MHHANMVRDVVEGLQEVLQQEQVPTDNMKVIEAPVHHVAKVVQKTQQQLATRLQKMKATIQAMQLQYSAGPQNEHQYYGGPGYHGGHVNYRGQGGCGDKYRGNWRVGRGGHINRDITHYCWTHGMCAYTSKRCRPPNKDTRRKRCDATRCRKSKRNCT